MRLFAKLIGAVWVIACGLLWIATGFVDFNALVGLPPVLANWSIMGLLASGGFGLSFLCIMLAIPGAFLWAWGSIGPDTDMAD